MLTAAVSTKNIRLITDTLMWSVMLQSIRRGIVINLFYFPLLISSPPNSSPWGKYLVLGLPTIMKILDMDGVMTRSMVDALSELCSLFLKGGDSAFIAAIASGLFSQAE